LKKKPGIEGKITLQKNESDGTYLQPSLIYMAKEIETNSELRSTTLAQIGLLKGNGLFKLILKKTNVPFQEFIIKDSEKELEDLKCRELLINERNQKIIRVAEEKLKLAEMQNLEYQKQLRDSNKEKMEIEKKAESVIENKSQIQSETSVKSNSLSNTWDSNKSLSQLPTKVAKKTKELTEEEIQREQRELMQFARTLRSPMELTNEIQKKRT